MKKTIGCLIALVLVITAIVNFSNLQLIYRYYLSPCYYDQPVKQNDFPQIFLEIDIADYYSKILSLASPVVTIDTIEQILYKEQSYPILEITKHSLQPANKLLVFGGVHGNESGGTLAILKLLEDITDNVAKYKDWEIKIVTPVNPAGTIEMSRYNENGCDLNRKVAASTQKGIVLQRELIASFEPKIIVTLHEAPSEGFLIHPGRHLSESLTEKLLKELESNGIALSTKDYLGRDLPKAGVSAVRGSLQFLKKLVQVQTLGDYIGERNIIEITTESGWNSADRFQRIDSHFLLISSLIENYEQ